MSIYDEKTNAIIKEEEIKMLLDHDDIKVNFYVCPLEVNVIIGNIIAVNFDAYELSQMNFNDDSIENIFIQAITNKINNCIEKDRSEVIDELRFLNTITIKYIYEFRNEAYNKCNEVSSNYIDKKDFLENEYQNQELIELAIGKAKSDFLFKRDPIAGKKFKNSVFEENEILKMSLKEIKNVVRVIFDNYTADSYNETAGIILAEITGEAPESVFKNYQKEGFNVINPKIDRLNSDSIKEILEMISDVNLEEVVQEIKANQFLKNPSKSQYKPFQYEKLMER